MSLDPTGVDFSETLEALYRSESRRILATLIHLLGDFDLAEDALQDAFAAAARQWPRDGVPANPRAWLVSTGRFKAIDAIRRRSRSDTSLDDLGESLEGAGTGVAEWNDETVKDDELRLIFTCCHPALSPDARVALTLREVCGLTTEEIAEVLQISGATVEREWAFARAWLYEAIEGKDGARER
jgi:RNA polymerase sigma-70 factor (ECF subfamily)